jgi:hypothetical protein
MREFLNNIDNEIDEYNEENESDDGELTLSKNDSKLPIVRETASSLVSLLRLLANLCIEEQLGNRVGQSLEVLEVLADLLSCCGGTSFEELLLNTIAATTNTTYYTCGVCPPYKSNN